MPNLDSDDLKPGDTVRLQLNPEGTRARWEWSSALNGWKDLGHTGQYVNGVLLYVEEFYIGVEYLGNEVLCIGRKDTSVFYFKEGQWDLPGFPQSEEKRHHLEPCDCGTTKTHPSLGLDCHSFWCSRRVNAEKWSMV